MSSRSSRALAIAAVSVFAAASTAQVTVPNEFEAGETARAADVNENFDALEDAATANALGVSDNAAGVTVNAEGVAANAAAVATQNANTGANATSITTNSVGISVGSGVGFSGGVKTGIANRNVTKHN